MNNRLKILGFYLGIPFIASMITLAASYIKEIDSTAPDLFVGIFILWAAVCFSIDMIVDLIKGKLRG